MFIFDNIDPLILLISFCIGLLHTYLTSEPPKVIFKHPTPFNAGKVVYKDKSNTCYKYDAKQVTCSAQAKEHPLQ